MFRTSIGIGALFLFAAACSPSSGIQGGNAGTDPTSQCVSACQGEASKCSQIADCNKYCDSLASVASSADCNSQFSAYMGCASGVAACSAAASCKNQDTSFSNCAQTYCAGSSSDANCGALSQSL
ncbi:MAG: hypothetical protein ACRELY_16040 [Polyangiaceae bacterium]